nr:uncharacterized protein LOC111994388 [Quercus suber]
MDGEAVTHFDPVVMAQQIQALTANVQELIKHNDELKRRARPEGSNTSLHRRSRSKHDEEASSPANSKGKSVTEYTGQSAPGNGSLMQNLRKELDEVKNAMKVKTTMNLDGMLKRTNSPFTPSVLECPLPPKFRLPQLEFYDGTKDPLDHRGAFKTILNLQQTLDEVIYRSFPATFRGAVRVWFSKLPASSIENFEQLSDSFVCHFISRQRHKRPTFYLLTVRQQEGESLRDYVNRFNKAVLEIDEADDQVIMTTFQARLNNPDFIFLLGKTPPTSMTDLLFKAQKYMNGEDTLTAKGLIGKRKKDETNESHGKKRDCKDLYSDTKAGKSSPDALTKRMNFTSLVMPVDKILMQIKDEPGLKWPKPLSTSSRKRDPKKYCRFHKDHGHYTDECHDLKEQIEELI